MSKVFASPNVATIKLSPQEQERHKPLYVRLHEASRAIMQAAYDWADTKDLLGDTDMVALRQFDADSKLYNAVQHMRSLVKPPAIRSVTHAQVVAACEVVEIDIDVTTWED